MSGIFDWFLPRDFRGEFTVDVGLLAADISAGILSAADSFGIVREAAKNQIISSLISAQMVGKLNNVSPNDITVTLFSRVDELTEAASKGGEFFGNAITALGFAVEFADVFDYDVSSKEDMDELAARFTLAIPGLLAASVGGWVALIQTVAGATPAGQGFADDAEEWLESHVFGTTSEFLGTLLYEWFLAERNNSSVVPFRLEVSTAGLDSPANATLSVQSTLTVPPVVTPSDATSAIPQLLDQLRQALSELVESLRAIKAEIGTLPDDFGSTSATGGALTSVQVGAFDSISGAIGVKGDTDLFSVVLTAGHTYAFSGMANGSGLDPYLRLYRNPSQSPVATNNDVTQGVVSAFISYTPTVSGTYYIEIGGARGTTGNYWIVTSDVSGTSTADTLVPTDQPSTPPNQSDWDWQGTSGDDSYDENDGGQRLRGHDGDDEIRGGRGPTDSDIIWGDSGDDHLFGYAGRDLILGGNDDDEVFGGDGNDRIHGQDGNDELWGQAGDDYIHGSTGRDDLHGNSGDDYIKGGQDDDTISAGADDDEAYGDEGDDTVDGDSGDDIVKGGDGDDTLAGADGDDLLDGEDDEDIVDGGDGNDKLYGGAGNDRLQGGEDNDYINGWSGEDWISFSDANDPVSVNLFDGLALGEDVGHDRFEQIENVIGGTGGDHIDGDHSENRIKAGSGNDIVRGHNGVDRIEGQSGADILWGDEGNDFVDGGEGNDEIRGGLGSDVLTGGTGDDELRGEQGDDDLDAGEGNDRAFFWGEREDFLISQNGDGSFTVVDIRTDGLEGTDIVHNVERFGFFDGDVAAANILSLAPVALSETSQTTELAPVIINVTANDADPNGDTLTPLTVTVVGGKGSAYVVAGKVVFDPRGGFQNLALGAFANVTLSYEISDGNGRTSDASVHMRVYGADEYITGTDAGETLIGSQFGDQMNGLGGNDVIDGRGGVDSMRGATGNDTYVADRVADTTIEQANQGTDTVRATVSWTLAAHLENLTLLGSALNGSGNALANTITGNALANILRGGLATDTLIGGLGNDIYQLENGTDKVTDSGGSDLVTSTISRSLAAVGLTTIENLTLVNIATSLNGTGNSLANILTGNNFNNALDGGLGNDTLRGFSGNDTLIGNAGKDASTGGAGNDVFRFLDKAHSFGALTDVITDFDHSGNDRIDVSALFGSALAYRHNLGFTAAGQLRINDIAGADVLVEVNVGGSLAADFQIRLAGTTLALMTASDFFL